MAADPPVTNFPSPGDDPTNGLRIALLNAAQVTAGKASMSDVSQDAKDFAAAVLALSQSYVVLDPNRIAAGASPQAQAAANPPMPSSRAGGAPTPQDHNKDGKIG